ncbi:alpha/beta fold hydrolase [Deltaproteobacteria bacterium OttesenSCG-928-K17]|nr:alpha/beta fold hydrolase [Deltaproteobacteria bacterium OttesenSCG-928-K17]
MQPQNALHYLDEGSGPPVIMVHGNPTWSFFWRHLIKALSPSYRCLVPDHMGMGLSSRPAAADYGFRLADRAADLAALAEHWQLDRPAHLIVHDWGGPIGLTWAAEHPEMVASITVMNSGTRVPADYRLPLKLAVFKAFAPLGSLLAEKLNLFVWGTAVFGVVNALAPEVRAGFMAPYKNPAHRLAVARFVEDIPMSPGHPSFDLLARTDNRLDRLLAEKPLALVWGLKDFVFNRRVYLDWQERFPQAQSLVLPEAGHYLMEDEPDRVCEFTSNFLASSGRS